VSDGRRTLPPTAGAPPSIHCPAHIDRIGVSPTAGRGTSPRCLGVPAGSRDRRADGNDDRSRSSIRSRARLASAGLRLGLAADGSSISLSAAAARASPASAVSRNRIRAAERSPLAIMSIGAREQRRQLLRRQLAVGCPGDRRRLFGRSRVTWRCAGPFEMQPKRKRRAGRARRRFADDEPRRWLRRPSVTGADMVASVEPVAGSAGRVVVPPFRPGNQATTSRAANPAIATAAPYRASVPTREEALRSPNGSGCITGSGARATRIRSNSLFHPGSWTAAWYSPGPARCAAAARSLLANDASSSDQLSVSAEQFLSRSNTELMDRHPWLEMPRAPGGV